MVGVVKQNSIHLHAVVFNRNACGVIKQKTNKNGYCLQNDSNFPKKSKLLILFYVKLLLL